MHNTVGQRRSMSCPRCDTENHRDARFCSRCETPLGGGVDLPPPGLVLANRTTRLLAKIIDAPFTVLSILIARYAVPDSLPGEVALTMIMLGVVGMIVQTALLSSDGQTIGKKVMKIKIVRVDSDRNGGFVTNVFLRAIINGLLALTLVYFVVDISFIFFRNRMCLHDYVAGTRVVRAL